MPRMARLVVPGYPHHVTQRGNRRQRTFFSTADYEAYRDLLAEQIPKTGVDVWAYCLMPNHVHLILLPHEPDSLARSLRQTHARYARRINQAHGWRGHLWQERFHSFVMDQTHLLAAVRYVERNPVRAGLCNHPHEWRWSSVHSNMQERRDKLMPANPMRALVHDWREYIVEDASPQVIEKLRRHSATGRPAGNQQFIEKLEVLTDRRLVRRKPGPRPNN